MDGGKGDDEIRGGDGSDEPLGDEAYYRNEVYGGSGDDNIDAGIDYTHARFYYVYGEAGSDYIEVVSNALIEGGIGNDTIYYARFG